MAILSPTHWNTITPTMRELLDTGMMKLEGILQFDHADRDHQPEMLVDLPWDRVRSYFLEQGKSLGERWFWK